MSRPSDPSTTTTKPDELRAEYDFDYSRAKTNRFASKFQREQVVVVLDEDIASVFRTPEAVKAVLRALIATMPRPAATKEAGEGAGD